MANKNTVKNAAKKQMIIGAIGAGGATFSFGLGAIGKVVLNKTALV